MQSFLRSIWEHLFRGHDKTASRIPWWLLPPFRFAYLVIQEFSRNRCSEKASALGFQTVFSLIPALALALFYFHAFGDFSGLGPEVQTRLFHWLNIDRIYVKIPTPETGAPAAATPPNSSEPVNPRTDGQTGDQGVARAADNGKSTLSDGPAGEMHDYEPISLETEIQQIVDSLHRELSSGGLSTVSVVLLVAAALQLAFTLEKSLNEIWGSVGQRRLIRRIVGYWFVLTLGPVSIGLSLFCVKWLGVTSAIQELAVAALGPFAVLYLIYQLMPYTPVHPLPALAGAFSAAVASQAAQRFFGWYLSRFVGYGQLYGNLGLIPLFLFWLWIIWGIVLAGAVIAYTLQNMGRLTAEERRRRGAPFIDPALVALGLVLHAGRAFRSGKGPVDADDLAESCGLPDRLWIRLVNLLRERGILVDAGPDGSQFIPGRPLESLRVEEIFATVEDSLVARFDEIWHPEQEQLQSMTNLLTSARQRELSGKSIADLLDMNSQEAVKLAKLPVREATPDRKAP